MENRVHYGEYSLEHWIKLILKGNIKLPEYQRSFVWDKNKVTTLIETLKKKEFVPPVTIGAFTINGKNENYILDGQQRLTSILLAYLGIFPNKEKFKEQASNDYADENDDENDDESNDRMEWTFEKLFDLGENKESILSGINFSEGLYLPITTEVNDNFFQDNFIGFSYIIPQRTDKKEQQKFYSTVFRNINIQGQVLSVQESRKSLYYLDNYYASFFDTTIMKHIKVKQGTQLKDVDFIKYLALLSQYKKDNNVTNLAKGFSKWRGNNKTMETYYEEYIYSVVEERKSEIFVDFKSVFPNEFLDRYKNLKEITYKLIDKKDFPSIIDLDIYIFGLIYKIVFQNKSIDLFKKDELIKKLDNEIEKVKQNQKHTKSPASLKYLRERIRISIEIYNKYEA